MKDDAAKVKVAAEMENESPQTQATRSVRRRRDAVLILFIVLGLGSSAVLTHSIEETRSLSATRVDADALYVSPEAARRMSLSFNGLAADWYWMRSLQYLGRKIVAHEGGLRLDDLSELDLKHLSSLLDQSTTLDPRFMAAYEFGAVVLPAVDQEAAIRLLKKGIRENPREWRLYHHLGYIHWRRDEFNEASEAYMRGSEIEGAPAWMRLMAAQMQTQGGSRETARTIYARMYEETDDEKVKELALLRLAQVNSLDERDRLRSMLHSARERTGNCPRVWSEISDQMRAARFRLDGTLAPLDPSDTPYVLDSASCEAKLSGRSLIPQK